MGRLKPGTPWRLPLLTLIIITIATTATADDMRDVAEGQDVLLECRFNSKLISPGRANLYWSRTNTRDKDNVAIGETPLEQDYEIDYRPSEGRYDLLIKNSTYDRDNGKYECHAKESGSGKKLHSTTIQLTVLLIPGPPKIIPIEPSATEGRNLELTCSSYGGSPDPLIKWYRSDIAQPLDSIIRLGGSRKNKTSAILSITPTREDDSTEYKCIVWNRALSDGLQLESRILLNVNYYPRVRVGPENPLRVERGAPAKLACNVDSKPAVSSVRWTRNGKFSETTFQYSIPRVSLSDAGTYVCSADNGLGQSGEADLTLDVLYPPIVSVLQRKEYEEGESVWIKCNITSNPRPSTVEWVKKGDPTFKQSGDLLRIERATASNVGDYVCRATNLINPSGSEPYERHGNATVQLLIKHAPGVTSIDPPTPYVIEGSGVTLTCSASPPGHPLPQYRWWREGSESTIAVGSQLNIALAKSSTEGVYYCQPNNEIGTGTVAHANLQVHHAPRILQGLQAQVIRRSGDTNFSVMCSAVAKPRPGIKWVKDGREIQEGSHYKIVTEDVAMEKGFTTVQSTLYFSGDARDSIQASDRGYYACTYENDVRREESHMYLRVQHKPIFIPHLPGSSSPDRVAYDPGSTASLPCTVQAYPKPEFDWAFNSPAGQLDSYDTNTTILSNEQYSSTLIIKSIREEHYGPYSCHSYNSMGNTTATVLLEKRGKPWPPNNLVVMATGTNSVSISFTPGFNGGYGNTKYVISYYSDKNSRLVDFDCQAQNPCNVTGLEQQTIYVFKSKSYNDRGYSDYSPSVTNMTSIDVTRIPMATDVKYEPESGTIVFTVPTNLVNLPLKAKLEVEALDGSWINIGSFPLDSNNFRHSIDHNQNIERVRASLCISDTCGPPAIARHVQPEDPSLLQVGVRLHYVIAGIVSTIVLLICLSLGFIFCCCHRKKIVKKVEYEAGRGHQTQVVPPPYFSNHGHTGMENKGLDRSVDIIEDTIKNLQQQQNGYHGNNGGDGVPYIDQNSYSNSNNGGSVDSQDSLWKISNPEQVQQQYYQHNSNPNGSASCYDYPQQQQSNLISQQYDHQYLQQSYDTRSPVYLQQQQDAGYGLVPKAKRRGDVVCGGDPYLTELSGLPDPYSNHHYTNNGHHHLHHNGVDQTLSPSQQDDHHPHLMQYDDSTDAAPTPNSRSGGGRRVIREIIV